MFLSQYQLLLPYFFTYKMFNMFNISTYSIIT
nr:MAG TPA: hypothetical protein [Caudoviricetes sp.]